MSKIRKPEELPVKQTVIGGIYGQPGIGKTSIALSFPKPLLIDTDNGLYRVQAEYRCDSVQVESFQDILDVLQEDLKDYDTIVIDTLGKLIDFILDNPFTRIPVYKDSIDNIIGILHTQKLLKEIMQKNTYNIKVWCT